MVRRDKSGSEAETGQKRRRNRYGLHTGSSGSTQERDWVVGSQILTTGHMVLPLIDFNCQNLHKFIYKLSEHATSGGSQDKAEPRYPS